ncbi:MAG TPA: hypothetical protein PKY82_04165 [Pyrinomonadaceae bacterium]|nr:hypothetical protein [Pyrinomonadaceae bacterium]
MLKRFKNLLIVCCFTTFFLLSGCQSNKPINTELPVSKTNSNEGNNLPKSESNTQTNSVQGNKKTEFITQQGMVRTDGKESTILYLGEETGDLAGFCFANDSEVGRLITEACKKGDLCEFSGEVDWTEKNCPFGNGTLSAQARILSIKTVKKIIKP